jgi:flagellar basal-body rod modification protein FlgD
MDVPSAASAGLQSGGTETSADARKATLDYNSFLTLLIAQIKNQNPTDPQDSAQYIAQLASFSSVEQAVKTNAKLDELITNLALSQADGVIGHTVTSADGSVSGVAKAIRIVEGGAAAILESGDELLLGSGVVIS